MNSAIERLSMLYNQAHTITTVLQTEHVVCLQDLVELTSNPDSDWVEIENIKDRTERLKRLIRKSKNREHLRWIDLNSYIYQEEN
jgi:hypothetical protein